MKIPSKNVRFRQLCWAGLGTCVLLVAGFSACRARQPLPQGPGPEYEAPRVLAWDAGKPADAAPKAAGDPMDDPSMNFDSVAVGDWVDETGDGSAPAAPKASANAGMIPDAGSPAPLPLDGSSR